MTLKDKSDIINWFEKDVILMETLLSISIALTAGLLLSRIVKKIGLPAVTGYLIAGILIGPYGLGLLGIKGLGFTSIQDVTDLKLVSEVALGFIAFAIGNEFRLSQLKSTGKQATVISFAQAFAATLFVDLALFGLHLLLGEEKLPLSVVLVLGAIATATAPAATLMVVRQYKAKGKLTDLLLPIVALDDAIGLVVFAISFGISKALISGKVELTSIILEPLLEVILSLLLGSVMGILFTWIENFFKSNSKRLCLSITFVLMTVSISMLKFDIGGIHIGFSSLLVCMMLGTMFCNLCDSSSELMEKTDKWTMPIFVLFFVLSGAELEFSVFANIAVIGIGVVYIIFRSLGKYYGSYASALIMKCDSKVTKNLGITLLPQAGVALGMSMTARGLGTTEGAMIRNIALFAVLIYEMVGPLLTKIALTKAGDIVPRAEIQKSTDDEDDDE